MKKALVIANGDAVDFNRILQVIDKPDLVMSVDGGARHLEGLGIEPHVFLGDFDSIEDLEAISSKYEGAIIKAYDSRKDQTDSELALHTAIEEGCGEVVFIGVTGKRLDHTLSNVLMLSQGVRRGIKVTIVDDHNTIHYLEKGYSDEITLFGRVGDIVSIIPILGDLEGVRTEGLEYIVKEGHIDFGSSYGISNVMSIDEARICIGQGAALVIQSRD